MELSKRRAEKVKALLIKRGVGTDRIEAIPFGETQPIAAEDTKEGHEKNRRIEIKIEPMGIK
jgi:outer membrane protein OmpA-like peptidoglycan-associated protein